MQQLFKDARVILAKAAQVSAGTAVESDVIDTANFEGVAFFGSIAAQNAANTIKVQQGDASNGSDMTDLVGTATPAGTNGHSPLVDVFRPTKRYVRAVITRSGANTATGDLYAVLYGARKVPVTQGATIAPAFAVSPAEA